MRVGYAALKRSEGGRSVPGHHQPPGGVDQRPALIVAVARPIAASFRVSPDGKARIERFWWEEIGGGSLPL
jgi:hypothetical protein